MKRVRKELTARRPAVRGTPSKGVSLRGRGMRRTGEYLDGQLLVAMPSMTDKRFARSVIYLCTHSSDGAMGLIVNQRAKDISFTQLLQQLGIIAKNSTASVPPEILLSDVHVGGPVDTKRGFVLHSADYHAATNTLSINDHFSLTATIDILKAMAKGTGPDKALLALGYAGWAPGQLEAEIQHNGWLHCPADPDIIFNPDNDLKYDQAMASLGIDLSHLVSDAGHA